MSLSILRADPLSPTGTHSVDVPDSASALVADEQPEGLAEDAGHAWLNWQCHMLTGIVHGEILQATANRGSLTTRQIWPAQAASVPALTQLASRVIATKAAVRERTERLSGDPSAREDLLAEPVMVDGQVRAVVVLILEPRSELQLRAVVQLLRWGIVWFETLLREPARGQSQDATALLRILEAAQEVRPVRMAATAVCDALRVRYACDAVAVGLRAGLRTRFVGASTSTDVAVNSPLHQHFEAAMTEACDQAAVISYPDPALPALCHQTLAQRHALAHIVTIPLSHNKTIYGALVLARATNNQLSPIQVAELTTLAPSLGFQLWLAQARERALGHRLRVVAERMISAKVTITTLLLLLAALAVIPGPFRLAGDARIEGSIQRAVVAPIDGFLSDARVRAGDAVAKGDTLAELEDRDLLLERQKAQSEYNRHAQAYSEALALHQRAQAGMARARMAQAQADLRLVEERLARASLRAPFAGIVVSGDFSQALGTPVTRGQVLFEIAPLDNYRVITEVDERDIGELARTQHGHLRLAGLPEQGFPITIERIAPVAQTDKGHTFFRVESRLDKPDIKIRPGMQGVAKFDAGERPLLWCWTHSLWSRLRLRLWSFGV
jgi:RND family efflux transporter MFP subunit